MRIGLIAMSGIRVCDAELLRLGLTLPGFVERSKTIASLPSLGLLTLAGMTPAEHDVRYIEMPEFNASTSIPEDLDLAAISSYSAQIGEAYALARTYRELGVPVVIGGPHVTALPEEAAESADAVVIGEGEACWNEVLEDCAAGRLKQFYGSRESAFDLAHAPMPAFDMLDPSKYNRFTVQTSRGCPHQCEFCGSSVLLTGKYKQKPVEKVLAEIDRILAICEHPFLEFADDNTFVDRSYWKELLRALAERRVRWFAETDLSVSTDDELLSLMRQSGCAQVLIGFESPIEERLRGLELRNDWKRRQWPSYREGIRRIQDHGITVNGCFVLGLDGDDSGVFERVLSFAEETELYEVQVTILTAFPGTPLYSRLKHEGRILADSRWDKCTLFDVNFRPAGMSPEELAEGFRKLVVKLYGEECTNRRRNAFLRRLRAQSKEKEAAHHESQTCDLDAVSGSGSL
ncbi:MAG TPA: radical SAM protein [Bryobacteraceae bacterium]|nr:radical SAM protein [Bryobacteraceae bacterium]